MKLAVSLALSIALAATAEAQDIPSSCDLEFPTGTNTVANIRTIAGQQVTFLGRGVVARCIGQGNTLTADSAEYYQDQGRLFLVGNVHYTEPRATVDSRTMTYYQNDDHLHAEGNVVAVMSNGSTLRGPSADYYRSTPQRPRMRMVATGRPTVTLVQRDTTGRGSLPIPPSSLRTKSPWMVTVSSTHQDAFKSRVPTCSPPAILPSWTAAPSSRV